MRGHEISILRAGPDEPTDAPPVLCVHGLGGAATNWLEVMAGLAADAPVVAVDLAGFGASEPPAPRAARIRPQVHLLRHVLDALGWERAELHGNSMGGFLSILFAGEVPERVARLVLAAPAWPAPTGSTIANLSGETARLFLPFFTSRRLGLSLIRTQYEQTTAEEMFANREALLVGDAETLRSPMRQVGVAQAVDAMALPWRAESLSHATSDLLTNLSTRRGAARAALDRVTAPILLVWGERDRLVHASAMDALVGQRPDITRHDLPGVGHVPMLEAPDTYLDLVTAWRRTTA